MQALFYAFFNFFFGHAGKLIAESVVSLLLICARVTGKNRKFSRGGWGHSRREVREIFRLRSSRKRPGPREQGTDEDQEIGCYKYPISCEWIFDIGPGGGTAGRSGFRSGCGPGKRFQGSVAGVGAKRISENSGGHKNFLDGMTVEKSAPARVTSEKARGERIC